MARNGRQQSAARSELSGTTRRKPLDRDFLRTVSQTAQRPAWQVARCLRSRRTFGAWRKHSVLRSIAARIQADKGFDPLPDLAALFIDIGPRTDSVRCQYYDAMNTLLEENLYAPMADWLHEHNMQYVTIATWGRENLLEQTSNYGDFPRMMRHFDIPGNEDAAQERFSRWGIHRHEAIQFDGPSQW